MNAGEIVLQSYIHVDGAETKSPYIREEIPAYFSGKITEVDDNQFENILGSPIPDGRWNKDGTIDINDAICQLYYAKSLLAKFVYKVITMMKRHSEKKGTPSLNILFIYNMPFRGIAKMTGGAINMAMINALIEIVNGKGIVGWYHFIKESLKR